MIKPTIGRVVHYRPAHLPSTEQPHAAIIAFVHSDECVNLAAFDSFGNAYSVTRVRLHQDENTPPPFDSGFASWMPYQLGQAAKTEELESKLAREQEVARAQAAADPRGQLGVMPTREALQRETEAMRAEVGKIDADIHAADPAPAAPLYGTQNEV